MTVPLPFVLQVDALGILAGFDEIDVDSDLFVAVDAGHLSGPTVQGAVPVPWELLKRSHNFVATLGGLPVFSGSVVRKEKRKGAGSLSLELFSAAKELFDCPPVTLVPPRTPRVRTVAVPDPVLGQTVLRTFSIPAGTLAQIATMVAGAFGVPVAPGAVAFTPRADAFTATDGQTAWQILDKLAKQAGAWLWLDEVGVLHVESLKKYYALPPVDKLLCVPPGPAAVQNNVLDYALRDDTGSRFSHVHVRGQGAQRAQHGSAASGLLNAPADGQMLDPELMARGAFRPLVIQDGTARNILQATNAAIREAALRRVRGTKIEVTVKGFTTSTGIPWRVTQSVLMAIPEDKIFGLFFIAGRRFLQSKSQGSRTVLTLVESGVL